MYEMMRRFAEAVDCGAITAAANNLYVSQPAVTKSLKQLEEHYGVELLIRGKKGVVPTEYGEIVYRLAKLMQKSLNDVAQEIGTKKEQKDIELKVGAGILWSYFYLPDALDSVIQRKPEVDIEIVMRPPLELHDMVGDGRLDLAVGEMPEERYPGVVYEDLLISKSAIFVHETHPLKSKAKINSSDLRLCHWIVFAHTSKKTVAASHDPSDYNETKLSNLLLACLLLQKGSHVMRLPLSLAPLLEKYAIEPIRHKPSETEHMSGVFYRESAILKTASLEMIKEIRNLGGASPLNQTLVSAE